MADTRELARSFLTQAADRRPLPVPAAAQGVQTLGPGAVTSTPLPFSNFIPAHQEQAIELAAELMTIANDNPGDRGLELVLERVQQESQTTSIELAKYALLVFITHHPEGQRLPIPPLEERDPDWVTPSRPPGAAQPGVAVLGAFGNEAKLDWYREDISANDHHNRWHQVYPGQGVPDPANPAVRKTKNRQGELFLYMHQQMLARYDTERLAVSLGAAAPLSNYAQAIGEGYNPNLAAFWIRQPNANMSNTKFQVKVPQLQKWGNAIVNDINTVPAVFEKPPRTVGDALGATLESSIDSADANKYGSLHNMGHMIIALIPDPAVPGNSPGGVMGQVTTAIRDPVFYRWHRHIDDLFAQGWQEKQTPQDFSDRPNVTIRDVLAGNPSHGVSPDIILCLASAVTGDAQAFGEAQFGGANFDIDAAASGFTTDVLSTTMRLRTLASGMQVEELDHDDFFYFIRVQNDASSPQTVTLRIFLAASQFIEDRRRWIELDKFQHKLAANERAVVSRSSKLAVVVRKPARRPGEPPPQPHPGADPNYCDCGWPYHLLLPRGTKTGMTFRFLVMFTDWQKDKVARDSHCGSMSFCGKRDADYPDIRPMGYPFDRKWSDKISDTIIKSENTNMAARDISIRWA